MRILVTGASGFIGGEFLKALCQHSVTGTRLSRPKPGLVPLDLRDREAVRAVLADLQPEAVIHCAARPSVDWCELYPDEAREINLVPVTVLARECTRLGSKLIFLSTDYVFDGRHGPYGETDVTNPINVYGRLKLEAEETIRRQNDNHVIVRTTNVYGFDAESKNFLMATLPQLDRGERVKVAIDQTGNPTLVSDLCLVVGDLIAQPCTGTFHVTGPDLVSRADWLKSAALRFGFDPNLVSGVLTGELEQSAQRPRQSGLVSNCLASITSRRLLSLEDGLRVMKREWDQHHWARVIKKMTPAAGAINA